MVVGALGLTLLVSLWVVVSCACRVFTALLACRCGLNFSSLAVLGVPSQSPRYFFSFLSTELSGLSVTGALAGAGTGGFVAWLRVGQASWVF